MSLRKSPNLTPARLEANRRNAKKSTGPRTRRGKAQSRMNGLRTGLHSDFYHHLVEALVYAPPFSVDKTVNAILTPQQARHPIVIEIVEDCRWAEAAPANQRPGQHKRRGRYRTKRDIGTPKPECY
jgi:hypothetical protein